MKYLIDKGYYIYSRSSEAGPCYERDSDVNYGENA